MDRLLGKITVVTGGGRGLGAGIVHRFAREGAFVYILEKNETTGRSVEKATQDEGLSGQFLHCDVGDECFVQSVFQHIEKVHGTLHVLINNAGIGLIRKVEEIPTAEWDNLMHVNLRGTFQCIRHALPLLRKSEGGSIVNVGSVHGTRSATHYACYAASKGGIAAMTRALASELGPDNIRVNTVQPGVIVTPLTREVRKKMPDGERQGALYEKNQAIPLKGSPEDVASLCLFLASDESRFITGQSISLDGGLLTGLPKLME